MGLFDKKVCDVCGEKIGLLGNRKLEDGNICKNCASKLSPWFSERRHSTLAEIRDQLNYREANRALVSTFAPTKKIGRGSQSLYIDEKNGTFAVCYESDLRGGNPDIIKLSCVTECRGDEREQRTELKYKDSEGKMVRYNPPQYEYACDYYLDILLNHPFIESIQFKVNDTTVKNTNSSGGQDFLNRKQFYRDMCDEAKTCLTTKQETEWEALPYQFERREISNIEYNALEPEGSVSGVVFTVKCDMRYKKPDDCTVDVGALLEKTVRSYFAACEKQNISAVDIFYHPDSIREPILADLKIAGNEAGILVVDAVCMAFCFQDAQNRLMDLRIGREIAKAGTSQNTAGVAAEWECPGCKAMNKGKFCEYCGTPRP